MGRKHIVWLVFGTRPEAIKLAPVHHAIRRTPNLDLKVCVTAQHRELLDHVLKVFGIVPDFDLDLMAENQTLHGFAGEAIKVLGRLFADQGPGIVLVQGDTTTALAATVAAFYNRVAVGHIEAGLRTARIDSPFPEEANRVLISRLTSIHFAPTRRAADALKAEGVPGSRVLMTGNTVVDALGMALRMPLANPEGWREPDPSKKIILVTAHRRESFGRPMTSIFKALRAISRRDDVQIVIPLHPNPNVRRVATETIRGVKNIQILNPLEYLPFVHLMKRAHLILTDSGGIQEEAPSLGVPVLVMRDVTERPEAVEAGVARVVGTASKNIVKEVSRLLDDPAARGEMTGRKNPFGDGHSSERIAERIGRFLSNRGR